MSFDHSGKTKTINRVSDKTTSRCVMMSALLEIIMKNKLITACVLASATLFASGACAAEQVRVALLVKALGIGFLKQRTAVQKKPRKS